MNNSILLFADRLPPLVGGMEMHGGYFIEHFTHHPLFPLAGTITMDLDGFNRAMEKDRIELSQLPHLFDPKFVFFNSGRWIEDLCQLRSLFPKSIFIYRTGGNEIFKAPLIRTSLTNHRLRQDYWTLVLNRTIDVLITNSAYTEERLKNLGVQCAFKRFVGGVNAPALRSSLQSSKRPCTIFCAARLVPYKNHALLLSTMVELARKGYTFSLRLAGDGPLLMSLQSYVAQNNLSTAVTFLGALDNKATCQEIAHADLYMQLSTDQRVAVPGGAYVHAEGMGRSILEAITAGTFVIAGDSGALSEIITPNRGILVDPSHPESIVDAIEPFIINPPQKRPFTEQFDWERLFQGYENEIFDRH